MNDEYISIEEKKMISTEIIKKCTEGDAFCAQKIDPSASNDSHHPQEIDEDSSDEEDEGSILEEPVKKQPLVIVLARQQTRDQIESTILKAADILAEKRDRIEDVRVVIEGFDNTSIHPAQLKPVKLKYAEAIDCGLMGLLLLNGFVEQSRQIYMIAYAFAQNKGKGKIRFKRVDLEHMEKTGVHSGKAYLELLSINCPSNKLITEV